MANIEIRYRKTSTTVDVSNKEELKEFIERFAQFLKVDPKVIKMKKIDTN